MSAPNPSRSPLAVIQDLSLPLIAGVVAAVLWANLGPDSYHAFAHWSPFGEDSHLNFHFLFNDIFMVFFFGIAAGEIVESFLPNGALNPPSRAVSPLLGTAGGVLGPIAAFFIYVAVTGEESIANGWGIPTATDIALAWLVARVVFGRGHPAVSFLLLLAVADDGIGLGIIAIFYPDPNNPVEPIFLLLVGAAMLTAWMMRRGYIQHWAWYILGPGALSWTGLYMAHLHPALALVAVVPFMPHAELDYGMYAEAEDQHATDTLNRFQHAFKSPVDFGLLGFGLANAGVMLSDVGHATWAVLIALAAGKTAGIFLFSAIGNRLGFHLPKGMEVRELLVVGLIAGLGLTVALFVAGEAFTDPQIQGAAKMGALMSAGIAPLAIVLARLIGVRPAVPKSEQRDADKADRGEAAA